MRADAGELLDAALRLVAQRMESHDGVVPADELGEEALLARRPSPRSKRPLRRWGCLTLIGAAFWLLMVLIIVIALIAVGTSSS